MSILPAVYSGLPIDTSPYFAFFFPTSLILKTLLDLQSKGEHISETK